MAEVDEAAFSLMSLEDELTCSICLNTFDCPVTIPCGHNFCQDCLLTVWKDSYSCPQCRTLFPTKPELKKNTVLSTVVETFNLRSSKSEAALLAEESKSEKKNVIRCDTCMEAEASQTCLTCMASYCEEHLRPHKDNPIFRLHQLCQPVDDLLERVCSDHNKLMELFCTQHGRPICSLCLQQNHKGCPFISPEEQKNLRENDLRAKLVLLDGKITKNESALLQIRDIENKLKDSAANRMRTLSAEYQQMRDMLAQDERDALKAVEQELESGQTKIKGFMKKFTENIDNMNKAKEDIHSSLSQSQTLAFLKGSLDLPKAADFEPHAPRINIDSKKVKATQAFAAALKEYLTEILQQPVEARQLKHKPELHCDIVTPDEKTVPVAESSGPQSESEKQQPQKQKGKPRSHSPGRPPIRPSFHPVPGPYGGPQAGWHPHYYARGPPPPGPFMRPPYMPGQRTGERPPYGPEYPPPLFEQHIPTSPKPASQPKSGPKKKKTNLGNKNLTRSKENLLDMKDQLRDRSAAESKEKTATSEIPPNITSSEKRNELLKYGTMLTLDPKTAHKRIAVSEGFTKASVSDEHADYPDCPERFTVCSQVLASKGFSRGRHYWEVKLSSNNFIGIGLAYSSIDRKGPTSRLGRNAQSWCLEWFNVKLSAWHNNSETVLENSNSKRVGVLLDCEEGTATFYKVEDRAYPFHSFVFPFSEAVYPAFWIFSSGSSVSLCKLQA